MSDVVVQRPTGRSRAPSMLCSWSWLVTGVESRVWRACFIAQLACVQFHFMSVQISRLRLIKKNSECHWMHPQVDFSFQSSSTSWQAAHPSLCCSRGWFYCMFTAVSSTLYCQRWDQDRVRFITQQVWLVNPGVRSESRGVCLIFSFKVLLFHIDMSGIDVKLKQSHLKNKKAKLKVESTLSFELLQG